MCLISFIVSPLKPHAMHASAPSSLFTLQDACESSWMPHFTVNQPDRGAGRFQP